LSLTASTSGFKVSVLRAILSLLGLFQKLRDTFSSEDTPAELNDPPIHLDPIRKMQY
jgi:hypothetical protein